MGSYGTLHCLWSFSPIQILSFVKTFSVIAYFLCGIAVLKKDLY